MFKQGAIFKSLLDKLRPCNFKDLYKYKDILLWFVFNTEIVSVAANTIYWLIYLNTVSALGWELDKCTNCHQLL